VPAFRTPLRPAVDPEFAGQKLALRYSLAARNLPGPLQGRLRLRFAPAA